MIDRSLFGKNAPHGMNSVTRWLPNSRMQCTGTQLIDSLVHCARNDHECNVPEITIRLACRWNFGSTAFDRTHLLSLFVSLCADGARQVRLAAEPQTSGEVDQEKEGGAHEAV